MRIVYHNKISVTTDTHHIDISSFYYHDNTQGIELSVRPLTDPEFGEDIINMVFRLANGTNAANPLRRLFHVGAHLEAALRRYELFQSDTELTYVLNAVNRFEPKFDENYLD